MISLHMSKESFLDSDWNKGSIVKPNGKRLEAKIFDQPAEFGSEDKTKEERIMQANALVLMANKELIASELPELIIPEGIVTIWDEEKQRNFYGVIKEAIEGVNLKDYIENKNIPFEDKMDKVKKIGELIERANNLNSKLDPFRLYDVKAGAFTVTDNGLKMNADRVCTGYDKVPFGEYIEDVWAYENHSLPEKYVDKYPMDENKKFIPSYALDVFGYGLTTVGALEDDGYYDTYGRRGNGYGEQISCVNDEWIVEQLVKKGYPMEYVESIASLFDSSKEVINPLPFLDEVTEIEKRRRLQK